MAREATVGDTFAVPWKKGAFGLCRVVWTRREWRHTSVVCLDWFGATPPELAVARRARLLELTHPGYSGVCWVRILKGQHVPDGYVEVGRFSPTPHERALPLGDVWEDPLQLRRSSVWKAVEHTLRREHRFRHDAKYRNGLAAAPTVGDVYALPGTRGWGACQVIDVSGRVEEDRFAIRVWLIGGTTVFTRAPSLAEAVADLRPQAPVAVHQSPPPGAIRVGSCAPLLTGPDRLTALGGWASVLPLEPAPAERVPPAPAVRRAAPTPTLETVDPKRLFAHWRGKVAPDELTTTRKILGRLVTALRRAHAASAAQEALRDAVRALNVADTFIETVEREELCELLVGLGSGAGLPPEAVAKLVDGERDW